MSRGLKVIAIVVAVLLMVGLVGAGVALAADPPKPPVMGHSVLTAKVAKILGIDQQKLQSAYLQAHSEILDEAVAAGQMSKEQAERMKERMQQAAKDGFGPMMGPGGGPGCGPMGRPHKGFKGPGMKGWSGKEPPAGPRGQMMPPWQRTPAPTQ